MGRGTNGIKDNSVAQKLLTKQLTNLGMRVEACWNGAEAVNLFRSRDVGYYSIFFVDQHMPVCDGIEATQAIRKFEKSGQVQSHLPIIALSADIQDSAQEMCKRVRCISPGSLTLARLAWMRISPSRF